ncbi:uncharacterized protein [Cicer arietinum]|uniref:uncharacterized protein n=1 Tax=Cicer arietinum TaxID=3827 RepID=UPI003CC5AE77
MAMNNLMRIQHKDNKQLSKIARKEIARHCFISNKVWIQKPLRGFRRHLHQRRHVRSWSSTIQMEEDEVVTYYFNRVQVVVNHMRTNGESLTEVVVIEKILRTLTQRYDHIVVAIEESKDLDKMKLEDLYKKVQREDDESQMAVENSDSDEVKREIRFADNSSITTEGVGKVMIQRRDDKQSFICDVLYVPNMKNNLLSLGQLLEKGYSMKMEHVEMRLFDSSRRLILKAPLSENRTFKIDVQINENKCLAAKVRNEDWLRHQRFGHLNFRSLQMLQNKKMVQGIPEIMCEECCQTKQHRNSIKAEVPTRSSKMMEIVYYDVCGPFEKSINRSSKQEKKLDDRAEQMVMLGYDATGTYKQ